MARIGCGAGLVLLGFIVLTAPWFDPSDDSTLAGNIVFSVLILLIMVLPGALMIWSKTPSGKKAFAEIKDAAPSGTSAASKDELDPDEAVIELVQLYGGTREGFYASANGPGENRVRDIGRELDARGGMELMRDAHARFARMTNTPGGARNLEVMWDGIGSWRG